MLPASLGGGVLALTSRRLCTSPEVRITRQLEWLGANLGLTTRQIERAANKHPDLLRANTEIFKDAFDCMKDELGVADEKLASAVKRCPMLLTTPVEDLRLSYAMISSHLTVSVGGERKWRDEGTCCRLFLCLSSLSSSVCLQYRL